MLNWQPKYTRSRTRANAMDQVFIVTAAGARMDGKGCESSEGLSGQFVWDDPPILIVTTATAAGSPSCSSNRSAETPLTRPPTHAPADFCVFFCFAKNLKRRIYARNSNFKVVSLCARREIHYMNCRKDIEKSNIPDIFFNKEIIHFFFFRTILTFQSSFNAEKMALDD